VFRQIATVSMASINADVVSKFTGGGKHIKRRTLSAVVALRHTGQNPRDYLHITSVLNALHALLIRRHIVINYMC